MAKHNSHLCKRDKQAQLSNATSYISSLMLRTGCQSTQPCSPPALSLTPSQRQPATIRWSPSVLTSDVGDCGHNSVSSAGFCLEICSSRVRACTWSQRLQTLLATSLNSDCPFTHLMCAVRHALHPAQCQTAFAARVLMQPHLTFRKTRRLRNQLQVQFWGRKASTQISLEGDPQQMFTDKYTDNDRNLFNRHNQSPLTGLCKKNPSRCLAWNMCNLLEGRDAGR